MNKSPAFQFYPDQALAGTLHLSDRAFRAYWRMLWWIWLHSDDQCSWGNDPKAICSASGLTRAEFRSIWQREIMPPHQPMFQVSPDGASILSPLLRRECDKQADRRERARDAAKSRWESHDPPPASPAQCPTPAPGNADDAPEACPPSSSSPPSSSPPAERRGARAKGEDERRRLDELVERFRLKAEDAGPREFLVRKMGEYRQFFSDAQLAEGIERRVKPGMRPHEFYREMQRWKREQKQARPPPEKIPEEQRAKFQSLWRRCESGELKELTFRSDGAKVLVAGVSPGSIGWRDGGNLSGALTARDVDAVVEGGARN